MFTASIIAAIVAAVAAGVGATVQGISNYQAGKVQEAQYKINQAQELEAQKQAFQEESLNSTQHYRKARLAIAAGQNAMAGAGNIGTSAESALRDSYFNLSEDISALRYKYGAEAARHKTAALNYGYNARVTKKNRKMGVLASANNVIGAGAQGFMGVYKAGGFGSGSSSTPKVTGYTGAVDNSGMYGAYGW